MKDKIIRAPICDVCGESMKLPYPPRGYSGMTKAKKGKAIEEMYKVVLISHKNIEHGMGVIG